MGTTQNSIVLNGKLYDAVTGKLIHDHAALQSALGPAPAKPKIKKNTGLVMDGVKRHKGPKAHHSVKPHHAAHQPTHHKPAHHKPTHHVAQPKPTRAHPAPVHARRHQPQRAATLMRHAVPKPKPASHHNEAHNDHHTSPRHARHHERLERAKAVPKSHHIKRFPANHQSGHQPVTKKHKPIKVAPAPKTEPHQAAAPAHATAPQTASERLVTNALKNARAHEAHKPYAKKPKKRLAHALGVKRRTANIAMASLAALLLVGFFVYQNIPNLSMRLASSRAGFSAAQPSYSPSGFSQDKLVTYSPGKVTISFHSNSDDRQYNLTQQVSNWNSQALADNYLAKNDKSYQTYQAGGKTVYIYDGSSATWVNGGVWYQIEGQSSLNTDQILKIANSI